MAAGPVPEDNRPGHHPPTEQDVPEPERFLARARGIAARRDGSSGVASESDDATPSQQPRGPGPAARTGRFAAAARRALTIALSAAERRIRQDTAQRAGMTTDERS